VHPGVLRILREEPGQGDGVSGTIERVETVDGRATLRILHLDLLSRHLSAGVGRCNQMVIKDRVGRQSVKTRVHSTVVNTKEYQIA
jgi:hypothetical protein